MLSAFPAFPAFPATDGLFGAPFPTFEGGFTPWDCQEPFFSSHQQEPSFLPNKIPHEPVLSNSGSENSYFNPFYSNSVPNEPNRNMDNSSQETFFSFPKQDPAFSPGETLHEPVISNSPFFSFPEQDPAFSPHETLHESVISNPRSSQERLFSFPKQDPAFSPSETLYEPVIPNSPSENSNPNPVISNSGSDDPDRNMDNLSPGWDETKQTGYVVDERKRRRMISNRESARRSRMRKKRHLENLRNQVTRHRIVNRELTNQLRLVTHHCHVVRRENDLFQTESAMLWQRLCDIHQFLLVRELQPYPPSAWHCKNITSFNQQNQAS